MKTLFFNGKVYTGTLPLKDSFAVEDGRFCEPGGEDERIDLKGRFVCAGFNDSHMHLLNYGRVLTGAMLAEHTSSLSGLKEYLKDFLKEHPVQDGGWLRGRGWNQDYFTDTDRMPDRWDLDEVSKDIPVMITRACGHCCVLNSAALKAAGIDADTPDPDGGAIGRQNGFPDGRLYENAVGIASAAAAPPGRDEIREMIIAASRKANSFGLTSVQTDDYGVFSGVAPGMINDIYRELARNGELTVRVTEQCNLGGRERLADFIRSGGFSDAGDAMFHTGPLKMLGDGSLGSRTAKLSEPYPGTDGSGILICTPEEMHDMIAMAAAEGRGSVIHAIGDGCLDLVLDSLKKVHDEMPGDRRDGIVHCQVSRPDQLDRIADQKLLVYAQSIFLDYDNHIVEQLVPETARGSSYSWKTLIEKGVNVSNGSDCPVEEPDVMRGIQCAVTRTSMDGTGPYLPDQAFTVKQALDSFTSASAYASFEEDIKGKIEPGMLADFTVLDRDPFETPAEELASVKIAETWLGGKRVYF